MNKAFACLLLTVGLVACHAPQSRETFLPGDGPYIFPVALTDSSAAYDQSLFTRVDGRKAPGELQLQMDWTAPDGTPWTETVFLPLKGSGVFSREACTPYRSHLVPDQLGMWTLIVTPVQAPEGLRGMGLIVKSQPLWVTEN